MLWPKQFGVPGVPPKTVGGMKPVPVSLNTVPKLLGPPSKSAAELGGAVERARGVRRPRPGFLPRPSGFSTATTRSITARTCSSSGWRPVRPRNAFRVYKDTSRPERRLSSSGSPDRPETPVQARDGGDTAGVQLSFAPEGAPSPSARSHRQRRQDRGSLPAYSHAGRTVAVEDHADRMPAFARRED
jgi:hypothetical protein